MQETAARRPVVKLRLQRLEGRDPLDQSLVLLVRHRELAGVVQHVARGAPVEVGVEDATTLLDVD